MGQLNWVLRVSLGYFFNIIELLIFIRIILSWISPGVGNPITRAIYGITEPILSPFRRLIEKSPFGGGMIDFSPILVLLFMRFLVQPLAYYVVNLLTNPWR
ncbi:MAG: YggT family protein [Bacillota bacterium]|jgi:YggT family protein|nr:YggT family protein [Bacillota bacterium]MDD3297579.1 YggT family protein [Bacillota bacterium]MDD4707284.1 YggT family protein [Bacillota bacterium]